MLDYSKTVHLALKIIMVKQLQTHARSSRPDNHEVWLSEYCIMAHNMYLSAVGLVWLKDIHFFVPRGVITDDTVVSLARIPEFNCH